MTVKLSLLPVLLVALAQAPAIATQTPKATPDIAELVRQILTGDEAAAAKLAEQGVGAIPAAKPHFGSETPKFQAFVRRVMDAELERAGQEAPGLRFHGQYDHLRAGGAAGAEALLELFLDDDLSLPRRRAAGYALGDVGTRALLPKLEQVADDFLIEGWLEREAVYLMARLGDRRRVEKWIAASQRVADQEPTNRTLAGVIAAYTELGEIFYRIQDYKSAVLSYQKKLVLLRDLSDRVAEELVPAVAAEIALVRYNLACSLSLSGDIVQSFVQLKSALTSSTVTLEMIRNDGDLAPLRKDPLYSSWLAEQEAAKKRATPKIEPRAEGAKEK